MPKRAKSGNDCFSNCRERQERLHTVLGSIRNNQPFFVAWIVGNAEPGSCDGLSVNSTRCLVIFEGLPVSTRCLEVWRDWIKKTQIVDLRMAVLERDASNDDLRCCVEQRCSDWLKATAQREAPKVEKGKWVQLPGAPQKHDPALLTMMFGTMGELLMRMDLIARRFRQICQIDGLRENHKTAIRKMLEAGSGDPTTLKPLGVPIERLPRVLLIGETGVGKTLFAKHLNRGRDDFRKVFIPEWLHKEDMLEYDLFGYAAGAYTDVKREGDIGKLLSVVGGVMFLDEIGTASPAIQAKLLGFMDDYQVEPRGWSAGSFECPLLVVAATNLTLEELRDPAKFRPDLLARFTDIEEVPPLRKRLDDLPFILDCLLQSQDINPKQPDRKVPEVTEIGCEAFQSIRKHEFKGNFRELENILRTACLRAARQDRHYVCKEDLVGLATNHGLSSA